MGISLGRPKASDLAESVRKNKIIQNFSKKYKKLKKTIMNLPIMLNFQKRAFRLRVSEKVPNENFIKRTKSERLS